MSSKIATRRVALLRIYSFTAFKSSDFIFRSADHLQQNPLPAPKLWKTRPPSEKCSAGSYTVTESLLVLLPVNPTRANLAIPILPSWAQIPPLKTFAPSLFKWCAHLTIIRTTEPSPKLGITNISSKLHSKISWIQHRAPGIHLKTCLR